MSNLPEEFRSRDMDKLARWAVKSWNKQAGSDSYNGAITDESTLVGILENLGYHVEVTGFIERKMRIKPK